MYVFRLLCTAVFFWVVSGGGGGGGGGGDDGGGGSGDDDRWEWQKLHANYSDCLKRHCYLSGEKPKQ